MWSGQTAPRKEKASKYIGVLELTHDGQFDAQTCKIRDSSLQTYAGANTVVTFSVRRRIRCLGGMPAWPCQLLVAVYVMLFCRNTLGFLLIIRHDCTCWVGRNRKEGITPIGFELLTSTHTAQRTDQSARNQLF